MTSSFTLSSGTADNSSASSALFDGKLCEDPSNNAFAVQLKKLYCSISALEIKILSEDADDHSDEGRVLIQGRGREVSDEGFEQQ
jgi:protein SMG6